ncbi:MAG: xanthine dehydrogenase family protein subunit M [Candidatus Aminicenantaceae bacterium]
MEGMDYLRPRNLRDAFNAIEKTKGLIKFIAGGTNVIPDIRAETLSPKLIVDLSVLKSLYYIKETNRTISIGALTTISEIVKSDVISRVAPILSSAAHQLGNTLTRNRATLGGNLADASPAADMAPPLLALEALIHTKCGQESGRKISLDKFFLGPNKTVLAKDEIITKITFLKPKESVHGSYIKLGLRDSMAISIVSLAVMLQVKNNVCQKARIALGAVAPTPVRAYRVEKELEGREMSIKNIHEIAVLIEKEISPISDIRASAEYRKYETSVLLKRAIQQALERGKK